MGVRGLTGYIAKHSDQYLEPYELRDSFIVIDGNSVASQLYSWVSNCNCAFGGDYDKYASCVRNFFSLLKRCNVTSLVIFDGGYEKRKLPTVRARLKNKLSTAKVVTPATQSKFKCFPLLIYDVFRNVLTSMEISFAQCNFEADAEIAAIARRLGCPVLSYDSDFYVYDVLYIPFSTVVLEPELDSPGHTNYIDCQIYNIEKFIDTLGGLDKSLLAVMAALLGNDYIERRVFENFLSQIKLPKNSSVSKTQRQITGLFQWLRKETTETAVEKILNYVKRSQRQSVAKQLKAVIVGYSAYSSSLLPYFEVSITDNSKLGCSSATVTPFAHLEPKETVLYSGSDVEIETSAGQSSVKEDEVKRGVQSSRELDEPFSCGMTVLPHNLFPDWFKENLRCGNLPRCFINMLVHHVHFSAPQVEDFSLPFSHRICLPLLCVIFGLLTAGKFTHEPKLHYIAYKENAQLQTLLLLPTYGTSTMNEFLPLEKVPDLPISLRRHLLYDVVGFDASDILVLQGFPDDWQVFIIALIYWGRNVSQPSLTVHHIHAILFSIISLNVVDRNAGYYRSRKAVLKQSGDKCKKYVKSQNLQKNECKTSSGTFQSANRKRAEMFESDMTSHNDSGYSTVTEALGAVSSEECFCIVETTLPYRQMDECLKSSPRLFCLSVVHMFAQFQSCLLHVMHLNALLNMPFVQCQVANFYSGTLIYNAYLNFKKQSNVEDYVLTYLLKCVPTIAALYSVMVASVMDFLPQLTVKHRKKRRNRRKKNSEHKCFNELVVDDELFTSVQSKNEEALELIDHNTFCALRLDGSNQ